MITSVYLIIVEQDFFLEQLNSTKQICFDKHTFVLIKFVLGHWKTFAMKV